MDADRAFAAAALQPFLKLVGPVEAVWALEAAAAAINAMPPGEDHAAAVEVALLAVLEATEVAPVKAPAGKPTAGKPE